jgi:NAD(P)H-hydrate repair Nnr-like enzyme with NAD(P)H-hydrate epimerase domain
MKILDAEQMRAADAHAIGTLKIPSLVLMENAATRVAEILVKRDVAPCTVAIACGKGNNGGDGLALARILNSHGWKPKVFLMAPAASLKADPAENWNRAVRSGVRCFENVTPEGLSLHLKDATSRWTRFRHGLTKVWMDPTQWRRSLESMRQGVIPLTFLRSQDSGLVPGLP